MYPKKHSGPTRIRETIGSVLNEASKGRSHNPEAVALVSAWKQLVGERLGKTSRAVNLKDGKLFVEVSSPVWKQELLLQKRNLIRRINQWMGKDIIADMVFSVRNFINVEQ